MIAIDTGPECGRLKIAGLRGLDTHHMYRLRLCTIWETIITLSDWSFALESPRYICR